MGTSEREVDKTYLAQLENKLKNLKSPDKLTGKTFLSDMASFKDHQLFHLMALNPSSSGFEDNFVSDAPITPNYLQRKIAPQTCAISKQELAKLVKHDLLQDDYDEFMKELGEVRKKLTDERNSQVCEVEEVESPSSTAEFLKDDPLQDGDDEFMKELREVSKELAEEQNSSDSEGEKEKSPIFSTGFVSECGPPGMVEGDVYGGLSKEEYDEFMQELEDMRKEMAAELNCSASDTERSVCPVPTNDLTSDSTSKLAEL